MGDERRDFDTPGRTNGQDDQTEPVPSRDETEQFAAPDETQASGAPDETQHEAALDETQPMTAPPEDTHGTEASPDDTQPTAQAPDETRHAAAPPDETQEAHETHEAQETAASPDETQPMVQASDETRHVAASRDETQPMSARPDETQPFSPVGEPDRTTAMPPQAPWSGRAGVSPPSGPSLRDSAPYTRPIPEPQQDRPWWTPVLLGALALGLLGVLVLVAWWMGRDDNPAPVETASATVDVLTPPTEPPTLAPTTPAASPTAQSVQIPRLVGLQLVDAQAQLDQLGLAYRFEYRQDDEPEGTVIEASPPEGLVVPVQTTVTLVISTGRERPPSPSPTQGPAASATPNDDDDD